MQSHSREATGTVTPFDKHAESQLQSDCCAIIVAKRLLPNFVKYSEAVAASIIIIAIMLIMLSNRKYECYFNDIRHIGEIITCF